MYGKIFDDIFDSSLMADGGKDAVYLMVAMCVLKDANGIVDIAGGALARRIGMTPQEFDTALTVLASPDPESKLPSYDGRRVIPLAEMGEHESNRGYFVVNHEHYTNLKTRSEQKAYEARRKAEYREKVRDKSGTSPGQVPQCPDIVDSRCEIGDKDLSSLNGDSSGAKRADPVDFELVKEVLSYLGDKVQTGFRWRGPDGKPTKAAELVKALLKRGYTVQNFKTVIDKKCAEWLHSDKMRHNLRPSTLFRASKFQEYLDE